MSVTTARALIYFSAPYLILSGGMMLRYMGWTDAADRSIAKL